MLRVSRYFYTIIHLKPVQLRYQLLYRIKKFLRQIFFLKYNPRLQGKGEPLAFDKWISKPVSFDKTEMTFLNQTYSFTGFAENKSRSRLWNYNLNYMDYLLQPGLDCKTGSSLVEKFIADIKINNSGLEPYPIALRGVNWVKLLSNCNIESKKQIFERFPDDSLIDSSLYSQFKILYKNPEFHLMGNHLLEDGIGLLFGAFYFRDIKFYKKASDILYKELEEQILGDGAHFELSPMYHIILLDRILDSVNLLKNNSIFNGQEKLHSLLRSKASLMLGWLRQVMFSNSDVPRVNDFAPGISPSADDIISYAARLRIEPELKPLNESGYRMFRRKYFELFVDYGIPGPDYIPGHAHADIFNFLLYVDGKPVLTDTGTSTYEAGEIRKSERTTAAHNIVIAGSEDQSDMWGAFRMGKRAKPVITDESNNHISGYHNGYKPVIHSREFRIEEKDFKIKDSVSGNNSGAEALFHFDPSVKLVTIDNVVNFGSGKMKFTGADSIKTESYLFAEGFNLRVKAPLVRISFNTELVTEFEL